MLTIVYQVPEWAIVSPRTRWQAAGGIVGAGSVVVSIMISEKFLWLMFRWYDRGWKYNESMSWIDRP